MDNSGPLVQFVIGGVQKGGTTALAHCLSQHAHVRLPKGKEAHVFDAPDFDDAWNYAAIDQRYAAEFGAGASHGELLHGDATPIYCLHERFVERIARYNPAMRWILLLRHPVERAISQYHMERGRGDENLPLLLALLFERWRLLGHYDDFSTLSPLRIHSYRLRGDYARQIDTVLRHFDREQLLLLRSVDFLVRPQTVLPDVYAHLGLSEPICLPAQTRVFSGNYKAPSRDSLIWRTAERLLWPEMCAMASRHRVVFD